MPPVSWGVLGVADIAVTKVIPAMLGCEYGRIDAIASRSQAKADAAAERFGIARSHGSYEELLGDPEVEAVYIPLPNHLHREWVLAAAEAGKHVLCEKPLALTSEDARTMVDAAERARVKLMEAFMYRLHPLWVAAADLVSTGRIGEPQAVQTVFAYFNDDPSNIRNIPAAGGGALYDIGCYAIDSARLVFGAEPRVAGAVVHRDPALGTDVVASAVLDFGGGRQATFTCSTRAEPSQRVEILGTEGRIVVEIPFNIPPDRTTRLRLIAGGDPPVAPGIEVVEIPVADPYRVQADAFARAVRAGAEVPIPLSNAIANLAVIEQIFDEAS